MGNITTIYNIKLYHIYNQYKKTDNNTEYAKCLSQVFKKTLLKNEKDNFLLESFYTKYGNNFLSIEEQIIFLIIIDFIKENISYYNINIISEIVKAFRYAQVNPYNYHTYLQTLLKKEIYQNLYILQESFSLLPLNFIIIQLIENFDLININQNGIDRIISILTKINQPYIRVLKQKE